MIMLTGIASCHPFRKAIAAFLVSASIIIGSGRRIEANDVKKCAKSPKACKQEAENVIHNAGDKSKAALKDLDPHHFKKAGHELGDSVVQAAKAQVSTSVNLVRVAGGRESLSTGLKQSLASDGIAVVDLGQAGSDADAELSNAADSAVRNVAGQRVGAILSIGIGAGRVMIEFGTTIVIGTGETLQGHLDPQELIAAPLAAAIRAAEKEFLPQAQPIPPNIKVQLAPYFPDSVLNNGRWIIGSLAIDMPDLVNAAVKKFQGGDNAVTVDTVTVFSSDPGNNLHWWAHEMQHHVQFADWGIEKFAYKYTTGCHGIEFSAESKAQSVAPVTPDSYKPFCP
jgi:hypothetical protein